MICLEEYQKMTPDERLAYFEELGQELYHGRRGWVRKFARETGTGERSMYRWRRDPAHMPFWPIALLQEWSRGDSTVKMHARTMSRIAYQMQRVAKELGTAATIAHHANWHRLDSPASAALADDDSDDDAPDPGSPQ